VIQILLVADDLGFRERLALALERLELSGEEVSFLEAANGNDALVLAEAHRPDLVVASTAIRPANPELVAARILGIPVLGRAQLLALLMAGKVGIAVAGTHGKTTTTELAAAMLTASGVQAVAAGNVGLPLIDAVLDRHRPDAVVVELSSFQLRFTWSLHLDAGAWLNFAPDHLDWHPDLTAYADAKAAAHAASSADAVSERAKR